MQKQQRAKFGTPPPVKKGGAMGARTRAAFFGKQMLWVVDCVNRPNVLARFMDNKYTLLLEHIPGYEVFSTEEPAKCLPRSWINCNRFVVFDFGEKEVWCLFPRKRDRDRAIFMCLKKNDFVAAVKDGYKKFRERCVDVWRKVHRKSLLTRRTRERFNTEARRLRGTECFELPSAVRGGFAAEGCEVGGYNRWNLRIRIA